MRMKVKVMLRGALESGCDALILGAFGCGALNHPPGDVAKIFKEEMELLGHELPIAVFAILGDHNSGKLHNPKGNFEPFYSV